MTRRPPEGSDFALQYCADLVASADEDLKLSLMYALDEDRARLSALFALQIELRRIPGLVSEAPAGEIRLQWWRDTLDEIVAEKAPRKHPVVELIAASGGMTSGARDSAERLIDSRARLLYAPAFDSLDDFQAFARFAEAPLASLAIGEEGDAIDAIAEIGTAYALARFAPIMAPGLANEAAARADRLVAENADALRGLSSGAAGRVAYLSLTRRYARRTGAHPWPMRKRLVMFSAILTGRF